MHVYNEMQSYLPAISLQLHGIYTHMRVSYQVEWMLIECAQDLQNPLENGDRTSSSTLHEE